MSRRHSAEKREVLPDPKFGNIIITKFMNSVMYAGKKSVAEGIVYGALGMIETKGLTALIEASDAMLKSANVTLLGWQKIGSGLVTAHVVGDVAALQRSVGFRAPDDTLACVAGVGSRAWDRLFAGPRPAELHTCMSRAALPPCRRSSATRPSSRHWPGTLAGPSSPSCGWRRTSHQIWV